MESKWGSVALVKNIIFEKKNITVISTSYQILKQYEKKMDKAHYVFGMKMRKKKHLFGEVVEQPHCHINNEKYHLLWRRKKIKTIF